VHLKISLGKMSELLNYPLIPKRAHSWYFLTFVYTVLLHHSSWLWNLSGPLAIRSVHLIKVE